MCLSACASALQPRRREMQVVHSENDSQLTGVRTVPLSIPPGFAHVAIEVRHSQDPVPWYTTFGVDHSDVGGDPVPLGRHCMAAFWNSFQPALSDRARVSGAQVTLGTDGGEPVRALVTHEIAFTGGSNQEKLPQNCAVLLRKQTALGGRRNRGRMFLPGMLGEGDVDHVGVLSQAAHLAFTEYAQTFADWLAGGGQASMESPMVILHSTGNTTVPAPTPVTGVSIDNVISTQRKRLR
jgi:hypothetical protein